MESIRDKVAIVGMGCCRFGELWDKSGDDLVIEAAYEAFEDAGVSPKDIQAVWAGTSTTDTSGKCLTRPLKLTNIPATRVENACATGLDAIRNACYAVAAGAYDIVLVVGFEKQKDMGLRGTGTPQGYHPVFYRAYTPPGDYALAANKYFEKYGIGKETLAKIAVKNHHNGSLNPKAHLQREVTLEQVMNAPTIAWPLGLYDCCGVTDGAAAAILTTKELARSFASDYVLIKGIGVAASTEMERSMSGYDYVHFEQTIHAGRQAYQQAGIKNPSGNLFRLAYMVI